MGLMTATILTMGVAQGISQIVGGRYAQRVAEASAEVSDVNAQLLNVNAARLSQQVGIIELRKELLAAQDDRAINFAMGKIVAATVGKGLRLSGSPITIMVDTRTQLEMDKTIGQYNLDVEKRRVLTESRLTSLESRLTSLQSKALRLRGRGARTAGVIGGISTMLKSVTQFASSGFDTKKYVTISGKKTLVAPDDYYLRASSA